MKKYLFLGIGSALMFTMGGVGPAQADNGPHVSTAAGIGTSTVGTDRCAGCHRVHTAKSNDGALLKTTTQQALCFSCHGATGTGAATDVVDGVGFSDRTRTGTPAALRGGGFDYALINSAAPTKETYDSDTTVAGVKLSTRAQSIPVLAAADKAATTSNHSIDVPGTAWGNGAISATANAGKAVTLECGSCHDPHGNGNYRILKPKPADSDFAGIVVTPAIPAVIEDLTATPPITGVAAVPAVMGQVNGIKIPDATTKTYTTTDYWLTGDATSPPMVDGVVAASPDGFIANISEWCSTCHTRYKGKSGARSTDSGDALFTYRHTTIKIDKVGTRNCITCHVAHGSNASMNGATSSQVEMPDGSAAKEHRIGAAGSRLLRIDNRGICLMCHNV